MQCNLSPAPHVSSRTFGALVARCQDVAYATAFARLGDALFAEVVREEELIDAHAKLAKLRDWRAFVEWVRGIVMWQCNRLKRRRRAET